MVSRDGINSGLYMTTLFKKLNFKGEAAIHVLNAPESFIPELEALEPFTVINTNLASGEKSSFLLGFCSLQKEVDLLAAKAAAAVEGDGILWIAYPKGTSKKYTCDFNRDTGWHVLGKLGFEPVRGVAIDEDWSALRFRRVEFIKKMTRSFAMTEEGKKKAGK
jgi:hypothetical protein